MAINSNKPAMSTWNKIIIKIIIIIIIIIIITHTLPGHPLILCEA